jgi:hypothetical protein
MALRIGSEEKKKVIIAGSLGAIVVILLLYNLFGGSSTPAPVPPSPAITEAAPTPLLAPAASASVPESSRPGVTTVAVHEAVRASGSLESLDPTLHPEWMAQAESLQYAGRGRNIFSMSSVPTVIEAVKGPIRPSLPQGPQGPPPPPPIDLKFFGFETPAGGARKAFLLHGEDVFIASEGDVVDRRYKVVKIAPLSIDIDDLAYNHTQTLPLVQN